MSVETSGDVSLIKDEDLLRKMWQDTEDFGRKKEIRAHMYKLREARLREFYNSGEVSSDIQKTTKTTTESKSCSTHADSLADHSFISMKTKEIRDSESPTRDDSYRLIEKGLGNQGWTVVTSNKKSDDGKTFTTSKVATTSGSEKIEGGQLDFAAKNEQQASVYKDGDDKNFTKAVGASSNTVIKQEASGGDENSSFKTSSTKTSSSSRYVTEQRSTSGDIIQTPSNQIDEYLVSRKTYTENIPSELKKHPNYVEGKTKVTRETRTLPDGTTVTTTKYEVRGGTTSQSTKNTSEQRSSTFSSSQAVESRSNQNETKTRYITEQPSSTTTTVTRYVHDQELQPATTRTITRSVKSDSVDNKTTMDSARDVSKSSTNTIVIRSEQPTSTHKTTVVKDVYDTRQEPSTTYDSNVTTRTTVVKNVEGICEEPTVKTTVVKHVSDTRNQTFDDAKTTTVTRDERRYQEEQRKNKINEEFIAIEKQDNRDRMEPKQETPRAKSPEKRPQYEQPERRQPIKPGKSELDQKLSPTEGQYDTTYRSDYINRKISVEVSPTHDAFARSLRAVSPDRISKCSSPTRSLRTSTNSLRSSTSPEKNRHPSRLSPDRRSISPKKTISSETVTHKTRSNTCKTNTTEIDSSTLTRRKNTEIDSSTLTRRKHMSKTRSRSPSPTSVASDIEFLRNTDIVTDLDTNETTVITKSRPSTLEISRKRVTDRSPTSPLNDSSPKKGSPRDVTRTNSLRNISPTKESPRADRPFKRTDTYEERCRQILGITNETDKRKNSLDRIGTRRGSAPKTSPTKELSSPERKSPTKDRGYPEKKSPVKIGPKTSEFPSQIGRSPEREPERRSPVKQSPNISEFSSQIRKSPQKEPLEPYPEKKSPVKEGSKISEFPSQIRKTSEREPLGPYPEKRSPVKDGPKISEFPSQIRKTPEREPLGPYPEKKSPVKDVSKISEFPSQIRKSQEREPLGPYPERKSPVKDGPKISEFPSQIRKTPEREPLGPYPEKKTPVTDGPKISEFPSQIRKSPEREPLGPYPEKKSPVKNGPKISEFPSQIRKTPEREPLGPYPEKKSPLKDGPKISEFPSQIRRSPEKEPLEPYPERTSSSKEFPQVCEFPAQIRKTPQKEKEPAKFSETRYSPEKSKLFPSSEEHDKEESSEEDVKKPSQINEFPSQIRKSPEKKPHEKYPEKTKTDKKEGPKIEEFPSQIRKVSEKGPTLRKPDKSEYLTYPTSPSKDKARTRKDSTSSTTTDEEKEIEEVHTVTHVTELEGRVPVEEPLATKKFISQLCKEEEVQRTDLSKKKTQSVLNREVLETGTKTTTKTVKKESPKKSAQLFIESERTCSVTRKTDSPTKKPLSERNNYITTNKITSTTKTDRSVKKVVDDKPKPKDVKKTTAKITLYDVENLNQAKEDNRVHIRTHRIDDTINKKVTKTSITPTKRLQPLKPEEPKTKKTQKVIEIDTKRTTTPKRHVVSTTVTVSSGKTTPKTTVSKLTKTVTKKPKLQNGHVSSDDESIIDSLDGEVTHEISTSLKKGKISRTTSDQIIKKRPDHKTPVRGASKPELLASKTKQEKCITTKSIVINNEATEREVIVDLQRSKSSREPTPDRICPLPVSSDDETTPRYPDQIAEPDETFRKPKKLSDIPILESEDLKEFSRITEVVDTKLDTEKDISLQSIDKKINKFSDKSVSKPKQGPAPKVERPKLEVTEDLQSDDCLLSVSQKVNKFITTAEQLTTPQDLPQRPKSPKCQYYPGEDVSVSDKVAHFITTAEEVVTQKGPAAKVERPTFDDVDETIKEDDCLLSVSDKVNKFIKTAKLTTDSTKPVSLSKIDIKPSAEPCRKSPTKETTPTRRPSNQYSSIKTEVSESKYSRRDSSPKLPDSTPKSTRRPSQEEPKSVLSPTGRLRSTETVKKAKALFENKNTDQEILKQRDILSRPSVFEGRRLKTEASRKLTYEKDQEEKTLKSTQLHLDKVRSKSPEKPQEVARRSLSPEGDIPGYMKPLDRSLRPNSPHRDSINQMSKKLEESTDVRQTKFGVTLRRTDSGRTVTVANTATVKSRTSIEEITEEEIEEIYDLEILEELLEKVVSYEIRRKIRAQIRIVKKLISEGKLVEVSKKTVVREKSPVKTVKQSQETVEKRSTEYRSSYAYNERKSSSECTKVTETRRSQSPETKRSIRKSQSPETKTKRVTTSPSKVFTTQLKKTSPASKPVVTTDTTPEWVKQRNLRKVTDTTVTTTTRSSVAKKSRSSPVKETKPTDSITSSYGVGPTDENGSPLFGLRALRAQNKTDTTKVQGTVIRSQYYSENGQEPVGEISVTKYSSDPKDLGRDEDGKSKGITSVTTTQKFGYKDTPSLKSLTSSKKKIEDESKTTKLNRRGSVKALSQKFIENAVETSKSERQSSYPKAGLILRTSSFKETGSSDSREGSTERTVTVKTSSSRTVAGETFLTNRSKVTGVQDVISRMKSEDIREGDSSEDVEARGLLNKFLGAQVILSGIESSVKSTSSSNAKRSSSTKVTTTITEGGKPVTKTRVFQHPITDEVLETVWDEQTLRLLLEQSTDYEERRKIRARLRQVMAEQEACTELVEKASQDQIGTTFEGESQLLPLLQGLLEAPDNEQTADSGTESGEDQRNGLIAEVQNALDKLSASLCDDTTDITPERRASLLQLVTKLQAGLAASLPPPERRSSVQGRFRRRQRPNRHTVGVSREELADARRLIEEISLTPQKISMLQKQNSEGCVGKNTTSSFKPFLTQKSVVKNAVAKPFSSSNSTVSGNSSSVQTPTDPSESLDLLFQEESSGEQNIHRSSSGDVSIKSVQNAVKQAAARKSTENLMESEETDEDTTVKAHTVNTINSEELKLQQPDLIMQNNPIYQQQDKMNKFNSKKLKMKRANTIDIPKPLNFYEEDDSDSSLPEEDYYQRRRSNYLALRGPIRVGNPNTKNTVPVFEPKTDNDKKFLAFINKHNENTTSRTIQQKNSLWSKPEANHGSIWTNKFGNIKNTFEKASTQSQNSARQFWKSADDALTTGPKYDGPKISKQSARNLRQMFEEKQKNVVTGSLKVKAFEPHNKFVPQPLPVNKFSHAPQSAFKPIPKKATLQICKTPIKTSEEKEPVFLYSPKPLNEPSLKPWATNPGESRVLNLAASKFENVPQNEPPVFKPRKLSREKLVSPFQQQSEKLSAPYLVKSVEQGRNVKQLTGQYDRNYAGYSTVKYASPSAPQHQQQFNYPQTNQYHQPQNHGYHQHQTQQFQQNQPQYTSSYQYQPQTQKIPQIQTPPPQKTSQHERNEPPKYESQVSVESLKEYNAVSSRVMTGPVCQQATTVRQKSPMNRDEHDMAAALNLRNSLQKIQPRPDTSPQKAEPKKEEPKNYNMASGLNPRPVTKDQKVESKQQETNNYMYKDTPRFEAKNYVFEEPRRETPPFEPKNYNINSMQKINPRPDASQKVETKQETAPFDPKSCVFDKPKNEPKNYIFEEPRRETQVSESKNYIFNNVGSNYQRETRRVSPNSFSYKPREEAPKAISPHSFTYKNRDNNRSAPVESLEINANGESIVTSKFQIPVINVPESPRPPTQEQIANKAGSWHQICMLNQQPAHKPSPRASPNARTVSKSKSSHSLALPKQFEAGMTKDEMAQKRKTMEAFLSGNKSPQSLSRNSSSENLTTTKVVKRSINRVKTSEKLSTGGGLSRSRTLPDIVCPELLDEENVDKAFEALFRSCLLLRREIGVFGVRTPIAEKGGRRDDLKGSHSHEENLFGGACYNNASYFESYQYSANSVEEADFTFRQISSIGQTKQPQLSKYP
ncbi:hypothetical protein TcasGA2_TC033929 [Tribolium castaneum]|uniref:Smoothelin domain-containing protein n=1 Tax=Tribolium castaneum TaxID=7070 RepID=A0A139WDP8_TRICA|nr:hypothetical protein TcasGA2_TC033929 [Tribolium castaneum]